MVVKADLFIKTLLKKTKKAKKFINKFNKLSKKTSNDPLAKIAHHLASLHKPAAQNYRLKFCLDQSPDPPPGDNCRSNHLATGDFSI